MTLDEAIVNLEQERKAHHSFPTDVIGQAQALGAEALKREKQHRERFSSMGYRLLPGETE